MTAPETQNALTEREWWDEHAGPEGCWPVDDWDHGQEACVAALEPILAPSGWALDLGCGIGRLAIPILRARTRLRVVGLDISAEMIRWAKAVQQERFLPTLGDGRSIPIPAVTAPYYVCAWSVSLFQHLPFDAVTTYLHEVRAVLQDGAPFRFQFVVGDPAEDTFLLYKHDPDAVVAACRDALLDVVAVDHGLVRDDWCWVTAVRR